MDELPGGIRRVTFPLPMQPGHVHCYLLPGTDGWLLVDTGLGLVDLPERWERLLAELDGPIAAILITHFHPDHVGGAEAAVEATGAPVYQGGLDHEQTVRVWGAGDWHERTVAWFRLNGVPADVVDEIGSREAELRPLVRYAERPELLRPGDRVDGWEVSQLPGHADGHLCFSKDGVIVSGDLLLLGITPTIGLHPEASPDPLGDYLGSLERLVDLAPQLALPGHGEPIGDPAGRAREIAEHHRVRLDETVAALRTEPRTGYEVSLELFGSELSAFQRRFAVSEALAHLERLVLEGRARRTDDAGFPAYTAA